MTHQVHLFLFHWKRYRANKKIIIKIILCIFILEKALKQSYGITGCMYFGGGAILAFEQSIVVAS